MAKITLTTDAYNKLLAAERALTGIVTTIDKAEECGIECQNYRSALQAQLDTIAKLKQHFAPAGRK